MRRLRRDETVLVNWNEIRSELSYYEKVAIKLAYTNEKITPTILSKYIDRSLVSCRKVLKGLVEKNIFVWFGTSINDSKQYYEFKKRITFRVKL